MIIAWCCGFAGKYVSGTDVLVRRSVEERKVKSFRQGNWTIKSVGSAYGSRNAQQWAQFERSQFKMAKRRLLRSCFARRVCAQRIRAGQVRPDRRRVTRQSGLFQFEATPLWISADSNCWMDCRFRSG